LHFAGFAPLPDGFPDSFIFFAAALYQRDLPKDAFGGFIGRFIDATRLIPGPMGTRPIEPACGAGESKLVAKAQHQPLHIA